MKYVSRIFLALSCAVLLLSATVDAQAQAWSSPVSAFTAKSGTGTSADINTPGSTAVLFHVTGAASSDRSVSFNQGLTAADATFASVTVASPTAAGEAWVCPATPHSNFTITGGSQGTVTVLISWRTMAADPVGTGCHRINTFTGFSSATGTGLITVATGKTATVSNTMTLAAGADSQTYTFPATTATIARTDAGNTFTGASSFSTNMSANHILGLGTAPTTDAGSSTCGTSAPSIAGKDTGGQITVGSVSGTVCHVNFGTAFTNAPACVASAQTATNLKVTTTTAAATITGTLTAGEILQYVCIGF